MEVVDQAAASPMIIKGSKASSADVPSRSAPGRRAPGVGRGRDGKPVGKAVPSGERTQLCPRTLLVESKRAREGTEVFKE